MARSSRAVDLREADIRGVIGVDERLGDNALIEILRENGPEMHFSIETVPMDIAKEM